jgi:hypothetical protein
MGQREQESPSEASPEPDMAHDQPGLLMFSRGQKLPCANRHALEMIGPLYQPECEPGCETHSAQVCEFRNTIQAALDHRRAANIWEPFELKRIFFQARRWVLARGLGLPDRSSPDDSRIVIVLEELGREQEPSEPQRQATKPSQKRGNVAILGSAQPGSDRGVFDTYMGQPDHTPGRN